MQPAHCVLLFLVLAGNFTFSIFEVALQIEERMLRQKLDLQFDMELCLEVEQTVTSPWITFQFKSKPGTKILLSSWMQGVMRGYVLLISNWTDFHLVSDHFDQISLSNLGAKVPKRTMKVSKRIVKSWVWVMTIRFGLAMTMEWIKSTRTHLLKRAVRGWFRYTWRGGIFAYT